MARILCVDDTPTELLFLEKVLEAAGHETTCVSHAPAALESLRQAPFDLVISDYRMPTLTGIELLQVLRREGFDVPFIVSTAYGTIEDAVTAIKAGAIDYIIKPLRREDLELAVEQALELTRLRRENARLRQEVARYRGRREIVGESAALNQVMSVVEAAAPTLATVLLEGESGTGKELIARAIHELSDRGEAPFVAINCAALPETLIESMLFGHEKGAFTGADRRVYGAFERAHGGTLLLDEVSEMRLDLQAKLLRVLQEREVERLGGSKPIRIDVRVVATTNHDLGARVHEGLFRQDLFYRLNVVPIRIPPLRERRDDIPLLARRFLERAVLENQLEPLVLTERALEFLEGRDWPGNVRELQHAVERAAILGHPPEIDASAFVTLPTQPAEGSAADGAARPRVVLHSFSLGEAERVLIEEALAWTEGNRTRASQLLGISDRTLRNKLNN